MDHSKGFLRMVDECRPRIREFTSEEAKSRLESGAGVVLVDVREDSEWAEGRILGAVIRFRFVEAETSPRALHGRPER